ncbi:hypothetical protein RJ640_020100 [Escallonia rubra]|uniref:Alginate lyase 2 domain-containing protein n=1 Tax=Escallonia rubra TaxID=112253 RepID=A0AA88QZR1_9ASTE|nr:hypothetical protein RJ640_020100 [Escallonia rubra]
MDILVTIAVIIHLNNLKLSWDLDYSTEARVSVQLRFKYGDHKYYSFDVVASDLYDQRVRVNVIYNLDAGKLTVLFLHVEKLLGLDYSSEIWQFEGYGYVPKGTSGVTIMQIFGARVVAMTLQLRIYDGDMKYYKFDVVATDMCDKWFRLNVIDKVDEGKVTVFIDGVQKFVVNDRGPGDHYFKFGA